VNPGFGQQGVLTKAEVLAAYRDAMENSLLHREKSAFRAEQKSTVEGDVYGPRPYEILCKYAIFYDHGRLDVHKEQTQSFKDDQNVWRKSSVEHKFQHLLNNKSAFSYESRIGEKPSHIIAFTKDRWTRGLGSIDIVGMALEGYDDQGKPIWQIIEKESYNFWIRDSMEVVDEYQTHVLEANTKYGHYTLWVDPDYGFNARRIIVHRTGDDLMDGKPVSSPPPKLPPGVKPGHPWVPLTEYLLVLDSVKIEKVGDVFLPTQGVITITRIYSNGEKVINRKTYKRTNIDLNPDFEAIPEAFVLDVPDGTRVVDMEAPSIKYIWQNGKVVHADDPTFEEIDRMVEELKKQQQ
jgi:hypothetical protein